MNGKVVYGWIVILGAFGTGLSQNSAAYGPPTATFDFAEARVEGAVDWQQLELFVRGTTDVQPTVVYTNPLTSVSTASSGHYLFSDEKSIPNWTTPVSSISGENVNLPAIADAKEESLSGFADVRQFIGVYPVTGGPTETTARVTVSRQIDYSIDAPGVISISVPYILRLNVTNSNLGFSYAEVSAHGDFQGIGNVGDSTFHSSVLLASHNLELGRLALGIRANGPGHGTLSVDLAVVSSVPEPETYAMLLAGLGLVGFIARRRKQIS